MKKQARGNVTNLWHMPCSVSIPSADETTPTEIKKKIFTDFSLHLSMINYQARCGLFHRNKNWFLQLPYIFCSRMKLQTVSFWSQLYKTLTISVKIFLEIPVDHGNCWRVVRKIHQLSCCLFQYSAVTAHTHENKQQITVWQFGKSTYVLNRFTN